MQVAGETVALVGAGLLILAAAGRGDSREDCLRLARRLARLRVFADAQGRMNLSLLDTGGEALVVSQFTLYADTSRGHRPSFVEAADPAVAEPLIALLAAELRSMGIRVAEGTFRAHMAVALVNDGPVTVLLESRARGPRTGGSPPG